MKGSSFLGSRLLRGFGGEEALGEVRADLEGRGVTGAEVEGNVWIVLNHCSEAMKS